MAIILRGNKGTPLTHTELDTNFREFFYSGSIHESEVRLFRSRSLNAAFSIPYTPPNGLNYNIQIKSGSALSGSGAVFTGSNNFKFDYDNNVFYVTGSSKFTGDITTDSNLTVAGTITAQQFQTEVVYESVIYDSGSTRFGDSDDDTHVRTGSLLVTNGITGSTEFSTIVNKPRLVSASAQIASEISGSSVGPRTTLSSSVASRLTTEENNVDVLQSHVGNIHIYTASSDAEITALMAATSSYLLNTTDTLNGDLTVTGVLTAKEINTTLVSSSVVFQSGSTKFGDTFDDLHQFTGSASISGSLLNPTIFLSSDGGYKTVMVDPSTGQFYYTGSYGAGGGVNITNQGNNRVLTSNGDGTINGEANLTFDGAVLQIGGTRIREFSSADTDINSLIGGNTNGTIFEGSGSGHFLLGLNEETQNDSFAVIGGGGDFYSNTTYDKILFRVSGSGDSYIGGDLEVSGSLTTGIGTISGGGLSINGSITATGDITAYYSSDERLKDNVSPIINALSKVKQIGGYEFDWNNDSEHSGHDVGVIAQEIEKVLPEVVVDRDNGYKAVRYEKIVALLIEAVKEQQSQIDELKLDLLRTRT